MDVNFLNELVLPWFKQAASKLVPDKAKSKDDPKNLDVPILQDVSGSLRGGQSIAILGPSGGGKTSLLNILSGVPGNCGRNTTLS